MRAALYTCQNGQNPDSSSLKNTADNSKESCAAACDALQECGAFDFTERKIGWSCRLVKGDKAPRSDGGGDNRKYCKGTFQLSDLLTSLFFVYLCMPLGIDAHT